MHAELRALPVIPAVVISELHAEQLTRPVKLLKWSTGHGWHSSAELLIGSIPAKHSQTLTVSMVRHLVDAWELLTQLTDQSTQRPILVFSKIVFKTITGR